MYQVTEKSTVCGYDTPMGYKTPFKYPTNSGTLSNLLSSLAVQLYPTGRAFNMFFDDVKDKFHKAINVSFIRLMNDAKATIDSCFPDNENFTADDCSLWEYRFGIKTNLSLDVATRRTAIYRRMARGRNIKARQGKDYLQYQLQLAGFDVYVYENGFIEGGVLVYKTPYDITGSLPENVQHGGNTEHGIGVQHGGVDVGLIANSFLPNELYTVSDDYLWATFFIGGNVLGHSATIPNARQQEFRELVLKLKSAHLVCFTFINYI